MQRMGEKVLQKEGKEGPLQETILRRGTSLKRFPRQS
jgi:hypothetical protein